MKAILFINEKSGTVQKIGAQEIIQTAKSICAEQDGIDLKIIAGACEELIKAGHEESADLYICAGGDGSQAAIAGTILYKDTELLPLPCGTVNMFCRDLDIPLDIDEALRAGLAAPAMQIDVGEIADRVFLNNVVFGAYAELADAREELRDAETVDDVSFGLVRAADALFHAEPVRFLTRIDGDPRVIETNTIIVSNNAFTTSEKLVPLRDRMDSGRLYAYLTEARHGGDFAALLANFAVGAADEIDDIERLACQQCRISASAEEFSYTVDGDPIETSKPVAINIKPGALRVRSPSPAS